MKRLLHCIQFLCIDRSRNAPNANGQSNSNAQTTTQLPAQVTPDMVHILDYRFCRFCIRKSFHYLKMQLHRNKDRNQSEEKYNLFFFLRIPRLDIHQLPQFQSLGMNSFFIIQSLAYISPSNEDRNWGVRCTS